MQLEVSDTTMRPSYRLPLYTLRWNAIFAGLAVGIATNLFLLLLGASAGLAVFDVGESMTDRAIPVAAGIWNTICMVVAAFAGGYVAARTSGMRRMADGILHGVVAWGVTMLLSALLATTATGATLGSLFSAAPYRGGATATEAIGNIADGDRQAAIIALRERLGLSPEQANRVVDQALILSGQAGGVSAAGRDEAERTLRSAAVASAWLSAAILLSLLAAMGGGLLGARGVTRRVVDSDRFRRGQAYSETMTSKATTTPRTTTE